MSPSTESFKDHRRVARVLSARWPVTVLAAGDEDTRCLGVSIRRTWTTVVVVLVACTLTTATPVGLAGIVGWVACWCRGESSSDPHSAGYCSPRLCSVRTSSSGCDVSGHR